MNASIARHTVGAHIQKSRDLSRYSIQTLFLRRAAGKSRCNSKFCTANIPVRLYAGLRKEAIPLTSSTAVGHSINELGIVLQVSCASN